MFILGPCDSIEEETLRAEHNGINTEESVATSVARTDVRTRNTF